MDHGLIAQAQKLANGRYIHTVANLVANYVSANEILELTEKDLRRFIYERVTEKNSPSVLEQLEFDIGA